MSVAVVTGANRGLGLAFTRDFIARGFIVHAGCRHPENAAELHAVIATMPGSSVLTIDTSDQASIHAAATALQHRTTGIDMLINNAAIGAPAGTNPAAAEGPLPTLHADAVSEVLRVNAVGPAIVSQAFAPLAAQAGGRIVNITSDLGSITEHTQAGSYAYAMSKAALNMLTRKLAVELRPLSVLVVGIHPGSVRTRLGGPTATHTPDHAARTVLDVVTRLSLQDTGHLYTAEGTLLPS